MKFAHIADVHLGGWREPKMREVNAEAFEMAIDRIKQEKVDFVLLAGDLFNNAVPQIESLKLAVNKLKELKDEGIPVYMIAGSHDFSPSGKTMLDVLETAGLAVNVAKAQADEQKLKLKYTVDKTGAKITGLIGKKGALETSYYEQLDRENLEKEQGYKIFMFHTALTELKTKDLESMQSMPTSLLPKGFDYYAGGHVHITNKANLEGYKKIVYPGPVYPNSLSELEKLKQGTIVLVDNERIEHIAIKPKETKHIMINAEHKTPIQIEEELEKQLDSVENKIVTIRVEGQLKDGKPSDINWNKLIDDAYKKGAYFLMKNTNKLKNKQTERINVTGTIEDVEATIIKEHAQEQSMAKQLMHALSIEKKDGEKTTQYEARLQKEIDILLSVGS